MLGVDISTVAGRLMITFFSGVGCQTSQTASQISTAKSISVPVKLSGEYSKVKSVPGIISGGQIFDQLGAEYGQIDCTGRGSCRKTTSRCRVEVELYRWTTARPAALQGFKRFFDDVLARLGQDLDRHIVGNQVDCRSDSA